VTPALGALCLTCRTAYPRGARCPDDAHVVVDLARPADRARAVELVWGDAIARERVRAVRAQVRHRAYTLFGAGSAAGLAGAIATGGGVIGAIAIGTSGVAASVLGAVLRPAEADAFPRAAGAAPPRAGSEARGVIAGGGITIAPASGEPCAAWQIVLSQHAAGAPRIMLRAGVTAGLDVRLDGGRRLELVPGPIAIAAPWVQVDDPNTIGIEALVRGLDPVARSADPWPPIGWDVAEETMLFVGDVVRIRGELEPVLIGGAASTYREAPATILRGRGLIELERA
jgi:hypothetical protein